MPRPKKKKPENPLEEKNIKKNSQTSIHSSTSDGIRVSMSVPSLSSLNKDDQKNLLEEIKANIHNSIHNSELLTAIDKWQKSYDATTRVYSRDYNLLKSQISEYLDSFLLLGYDSEGQRIIIQHYHTQRDRDAVIEFLKNVFLLQQQQNFLDADSEEDDEDDNLNI